MSAALTLAGRDLRAWFSGAYGFSLLAAVQLLLAWQFLTALEGYLELAPRLAGVEGGPGVTELVATPFLGRSLLVLILFSPLVALRLFAEDQRQGTLPLLFTAPVSLSSLVLGRFLSAGALMLAPVLLAAALVASLWLGGSPDLGRLAIAILMMSLAALTLAALAVACSTLARHPAGAAAGTFALALVLWLLDEGARARGVRGELINQLALGSRLENGLAGILHLGDLAYFGALIGLLLCLAWLRLAALRERP